MSKHPQSKQRSPASAGKRVWVPALLIPVLAVLAMGAWFFSARFPRVEVSGCRISEEEYLRAMYQARSDVLSDHAAAGISLADWHAHTPLGDPCGLTMERTLEILTEYYAVGTLAVERGYLADAGYGAMLEDMEEINRRRQEALDAGAPVTGIPKFTTDDYLSYRASGLRLQFCSDSGNPEYQVTQEEIRQRYEADRDELYRQPDSMELAFLVIDGADGKTEQALQDLHRKALATGNLAAALEELPQLEDCYQEISVTPGTYSVYARSLGDILAWAAELEEGDISSVLRQEDRLCLIQCLQRTDHDYIPLEDVESVVVQAIRESRYDDILAQRMENTEIRGDLQALYRFTAEQLP